MGGAEFALLESVKGLKEKDVEIQVILPARRRLAGRLEAMGVPTSVFVYRPWVNGGVRFDQSVRHLLKERPVWNAISDFLRRTRTDLVVSNTLVSPAGAFASKWANIPHVWYIHELFGVTGHGIFFDLGDPLSLFLISRLSKRIIVNSRVVEREFQKRISPDKISQLYCAVEVPTRPQQIKSPRKSFELIKVSRLAPGKRQEDAIRALSLLVKKGIDMRLTLIGNEWPPEYGVFLRRLAAELGVEERMDFVAFTEDSFSHVAASDLALMCSIGESFGRVTVEAMKLGIPVVGANSAGTAELIRDGFNGLLYEPANATDLAAKIETLYHDRALLNKLGENAQAWSTQTFNLENHTSDLLRVFAEASSSSL